MVGYSERVFVCLLFTSVLLSDLSHPNELKQISLVGSPLNQV